MHRFWHVRSRLSRLSVILSLVVLASLVGGVAFFTGAAGSTRPVLARGLTYAGLSALQKAHLSGLVFSELNASRGAAHSSSAATARSTFTSTSEDGCFGNQGNNIRVNHNCLNITDTDLQGRAQTQVEPALAGNPLHPEQLVAGLNDYRNGDSSCSSAFSRDGGAHWTEAGVPIGFSRGNTFGGVQREYWQVSGNTSVAWDTRGNAYLNCETFMRGPGTTNNADFSSAFYLFRSTGGPSWNFPGHAVVEAFTQDPAVLVNKPAMAVDDTIGSPFQDRIYVTWTIFAGDGSMYVEAAHSSDYGQSFSAPTLVSSSSPLCANTLGVGTPQGPCNANEFSVPFTGPDGAFYVVYNNFNTALTDANDNHFQLLLSKSTDGGVTFQPPVLVANYFDLPDCGTYQGGQNNGVNCMPEKGAGQNSVFRSTNFSSGAVNPVDGSVVVTYGSYINRDSNAANGCLPAGFAADGDAIYTGVKTVGACNNKILVSVSTNGGASFNGNITDPTTMPIVTSAPAQRLTDQWFPSAAFTRDGKLAVSYYDRQYGHDETTGALDFSLSSSRDLRHFAASRVTSSSLPLPTQFPDERGNGTFLGDYAGLAAGIEAHPIWTDTRNPDLALCPGTGTTTVPPRVCTFTSVPGGPRANDEAIFTASLAVKTP